MRKETLSEKTLREIGEEGFFDGKRNLPPLNPYCNFYEREAYDSGYDRGARAKKI